MTEKQYKCKYCGANTGTSVEELELHKIGCYERPKMKEPELTLPPRRLDTRLNIKNFIGV